MSVAPGRPIMSGAQVKAAQPVTPLSAPVTAPKPASPTPTGQASAPIDWNQILQQQFQQINQGNDLPTDLPIESDPAYRIFQSNTGLSRALSRIGVEQDVPEIQRQANVGLSNLDTSERQSREGAESNIAQRGLSSSGLAAQRYTDIAGQYGRARQDVASGAQAQIDRSRALDAATQRAGGAQGASQAVSAAGRTAGV